RSEWPTALPPCTPALVRVVGLDSFQHHRTPFSAACVSTTKFPNLAGGFRSGSTTWPGVSSLGHSPVEGRQGPGPRSGTPRIREGATCPPGSTSFSFRWRASRSFGASCSRGNLAPDQPGRSADTQGGTNGSNRGSKKTAPPMVDPLLSLEPKPTWDQM